MWAVAATLLRRNVAQSSTCSSRIGQIPHGRDAVSTVAKSATMKLVRKSIFSAFGPSKWSQVVLKKTTVRCYSSSPRTTTRTSGGARHAIPLSSALRKFYMKVHPDLFSGHAKEQSTNESSFKVLTEYLENYKQEEESAKPYKLEFYVRVSGEGGASQLKQVTATLTLPSKHSSAEAREAMLKHNLGKLFRQCDYHDDFDVSGYGSAIKKLRSAGSNETSFVSVVMAAALRFNANPSAPGVNAKKSAAQLELEKIRDGLKASNQALQDKLAKEYGVKFGLEVPAILFKTPIERLRMVKSWLETAQSALDDLKHTIHKMDGLKGKSIIFGYRKQGPLSPNSIYLEIAEGRTSWTETLAAISPEQDKKYLETMQELEQLATEAATLLNLKKIDALPAVTLRRAEEYKAQLQKFITHGKTNAYKWKSLPPNLNRISVKIVERIDGVYSSDLASGSINFPVINGPAELLALLEQNGRQLVAENREFEAALKLLKDRFGLANLAVAPDVSSENTVECLNRLIDGYHLLRQYLTGLNLCIANDYSVNEDSKILFVKYDFLF